jgi:hypothetical protein
MTAGVPVFKAANRSKYIQNNVCNNSFSEPKYPTCNYSIHQKNELKKSHVERIGHVCVHDKMVVGYPSIMNIPRPN